MMKRATTLGAVAALIAAPALAGGVAPPAPDPVVEVPAPATPNWTGFYGGVELGYADVDTDLSGVDGDGVIGGVIAGFDYDMGDWVVGVGADYDIADISLSNTAGSELDEVFRAKLRAGYKIGRGLLYGTGGYTWADTNNIDDDDGFFIGGGYEYLVTDQLSLGAEVLYHEYDDFGDVNTDVEVWTIQARAAFRF